MTEARWRRRADARPDEILDAALDEFLLHGFEAARMDAIAARAGLSKAGVYLYFETKDALLKALIERAVRPLALQAEALARAQDLAPEEAVRALVEMAMARLDDPRVFAIPRLVLSIAPRFPDIVAFYREEVVDRGRGALATLMEAGMARGVFRRVDTDAAVRAIIGPIIMAALLRHVMGDASASGDPRARAHTHIDLIMKGLGA